MIYVIALILLGFAITGMKSLFQSVPGREDRVSKIDRMAAAKAEYEGNLEAINQFPDPLVRQAATNAANMKLRRTLEALLKE
ncbi:MAG: hypothetical protein QM775_25685 [Pirellulales bacterium]